MKKYLIFAVMLFYSASAFADIKFNKELDSKLDKKISAAVEKSQVTKADMKAFLRKYPEFIRSAKAGYPEFNELVQAAKGTIFILNDVYYQQKNEGGKQYTDVAFTYTRDGKPYKIKKTVSGYHDYSLAQGRYGREHNSDRNDIGLIENVYKDKYPRYKYKKILENYSEFIRDLFAHEIFQVTPLDSNIEGEKSSYYFFQKNNGNIAFLSMLKVTKNKSVKLKSSETLELKKDDVFFVFYKFDSPGYVQVVPYSQAKKKFLKPVIFTTNQIKNNDYLEDAIHSIWKSYKHGVYYPMEEIYWYESL